MKVFISGATGFIGSRLSMVLAGSGCTVHALYRSESRTGPIIHPNIKLFKGDLLDQKAIRMAMEGCETAYHTAAFAKAWDPDPNRFYRQNVSGTLVVLEEAVKAGIRKVVITSTAGVMGSNGKEAVTENSFPDKHYGEYEYSKALMEELTRAYSHSGMEIVLVNPTRVYGPGVMNESNSVTLMMDKYRKGKWHIIPGNGESIGNYVFIEDAVKGHILAMEKGKSGERYLLGGENASFNRFFSLLSELTGRKNFMIPVPFSLMLMISGAMIFLARTVGTKPLLTPAHVRKFSEDFLIDCRKAAQQLDYQPSGLREGMKKTLLELMDQKHGK